MGLQPTLCGKSNLDVADDFNLKGKLGGDIPASFEDEIHSSTGLFCHIIIQQRCICHMFKTNAGVYVICVSKTGVIFTHETNIGVLVTCV